MISNGLKPSPRGTFTSNSLGGVEDIFKGESFLDIDIGEKDEVEVIVATAMSNITISLMNMTENAKKLVNRYDLL